MVVNCRYHQFTSRSIARQFVRLWSKEVAKPTPGSEYVKPTAGLKHYLVEKCYKFVQGYETFLQNKFPKFFRVYRVFSLGAKDLYSDIKEYMRISHDLSLGRTVRSLSRKELEIYFQTPKDMIKVSPVLLIATLPFANYVIFPLAYWFPKQLLSPQFWSLQQRVDFAVQKHKRRLYNYRPVFRHLQANVATIRDDELKEKCAEILNKVGSGVHPTVSEVLEIKSLFSDEPYALGEISSRHLRRLCHLHGLSAFLGSRYRLWTHAGFVREMDLAMVRDGMQGMTLDELRWACFLRGLSPLGLSREEMTEWLEQWLTISKNINDHCLSLLLHCPILLAYNYTSNWVLIH